MEEHVRYHMIVSGRVQGVGFRYRVSHAANALGLTGWVTNCWNDTVELEVYRPSTNNTLTITLELSESTGS